MITILLTDVAKLIKVSARTFVFKSTKNLIHLRNWLLEDPKAFAAAFDRDILQPMLRAA